MGNNILLVDDDPDLIRVMAKLLSGLGQFRFATNGESALELAREWGPDLILLDAEMPGMSGYQVCDAMKSDPKLREIPIIFVTSHNDRDFEVKALEMGAVDFLSKPLSEHLAMARVRNQLRIKRLTDELRRATTRDLLTQLPNENSFHETLGMEWTRAIYDGAPISLLHIELDHFDAYADTYGRAQTDRRLREVAKGLQGLLEHPADSLARLDYATFALLMPGTAHKAAIERAHRALVAVETLHIDHHASPISQHLTASVGMAAYDESSAWWLPAQPGERQLVVPGCHAQDLARCARIALLAAHKKGPSMACWAKLVPATERVRCQEAVPSLSESERWTSVL